MVIKTLLTTLLQLFGKIILNYKLNAKLKYHNSSKYVGRLKPFKLIRVPIEIFVFIYDTFGDNVGIKNYFTKHLMGELLVINLINISPSNIFPFFSVGFHQKCQFALVTVNSP